MKAIILFWKPVLDKSFFSSVACCLPSVFQDHSKLLTLIYITPICIFSHVLSHTLLSLTSLIPSRKGPYQDFFYISHFATSILTYFLVQGMLSSSYFFFFFWRIIYFFSLAVYKFCLPWTTVLCFIMAFLSIFILFYFETCAVILSKIFKYYDILLSGQCSGMILW